MRFNKSRCDPEMRRCSVPACPVSWLIPGVKHFSYLMLYCIPNGSQHELKKGKTNAHVKIKCQQHFTNWFFTSAYSEKFFSNLNRKWICCLNPTTHSKVWVLPDFERPTIVISQSVKENSAGMKDPKKGWTDIKKTSWLVESVGH